MIRHFYTPLMYRASSALDANQTLVATLHRIDYFSVEPKRVSYQTEAIMATPEEQRAEEKQAIEDERKAFERRQRAYLTVTVQFTPRGSGVPRDDDLKELAEADADWKAKNAVMERIGAEIRSGKRR
ncbi:hypothetical protein [Burkholderia vietnamiensis]|uniref:hypothetical protein n=1 Tax=Burkholderia vietnamiensis TaxID=60552 RepID=UPI001CF465BE|nr:hypothetical protein [Burkholderia vietnamiensis]